MALSMIPKVGPVSARALVSYCGGVDAVFRASKRELLRVPGIGPELANAVLDPACLTAAERQLAWAEKEGVQCIFYLDKNYPQRLRHFEDAPVMLFQNGPANLNHPRIVSIVGTRTPTERGRELTRKLVEELAAYEVLVVSGMAFGVDIAAHRASIEAEVPTVAVLAHGLHAMYPPTHLPVARAMCAAGGAVVSEHPLGTDARKEFFPMRNRIIAGLCDALVVVETDQRGGSMISAQYANDYQKDVFAMPGRPGDTKSRGCNLLIKTHRAALLESASDLADLLRWELPGTAPRGGAQRQLFAELSEEEAELVQLLKDREGVSLDELLVRSKRTASVISALLLELEFKGVVRALPGKIYSLVL